MTGWLLKVTHFAVKESRRAATRRAVHERQARTAQRGAAVESSIDAAIDPEMTALLDESLLQLGTLDREVIVRRYLQGEGVQEVARAAGMSENAAGHRLSRRLEKLRKLFRNRGVAVPAVPALLTVFAAQASVKAPAAALAVASQTTVGLAKLVAWRLSMSKAVSSVVAACVIALTGVAAAGVGMVIDSAMKHEPPQAPTVTVAAIDTGIPDFAADAPATQPVVRVTAVTEGDSDKLLKELLAGIDENRKKLKTLQITSETRREKWDPDKTAWVDDGSIEGTAWLELVEPQRGRFEVQLERIPWTNGAAPFVSEGYTEVWDGKEDRRQFREMRFSQARGEIREANGSSAERILGREYAMQLARISFQDDNGKLVTEDPLDFSRVARDLLTARRVMLNDHQAALELQVSRPVAKDFKQLTEYWFDPARGFALVGFRVSVSGINYSREFVVDSLIEAAPGVYLPTRARFVSRNRDSSADRTSFKASKVVANEALPADTFKLQFDEKLEVSKIVNGVEIPVKQN